MQVPFLKEALQACPNCCLTPILSQLDHMENRSPPPSPETTTNPPKNPHQEFVSAISSSIQPKSKFTNHESLPSLQESLSCLNKTCPQYLKTILVDQIRSQEYYHLALTKRVFLDYIGNCLFSYSQQENYHFSRASTSNADFKVPFFDISYKYINLNSQLLYGGNELEFESSMRRRIMRYMNFSENDYSMIFIANQSSGFKILADSYPFESNKNLITVYDHNNEAIEGMIKSAKYKGSKTISAEFSWPSLRINSRKLRKMIKKNKGLFVFPLQSRMSGSRYSYLWMNMAQENGWHILLDADSLGSKPMDTVGLSLFNPDFIICSFYKVFGENPSGFSCLFVKKSSISMLGKSSKSIGIVSLLPSSREVEDEYSKIPIPIPPSRLKSLGELFREDIEIMEARKGKMKKELSYSDLANLELDTTLDSDRDSNSSEIECRGLDGNANSSEVEVEVECKDLDRGSNSSEVECGDLDRVDNSAEVECRGLDHADKIGLILISARAKYQVNWLINAMISLQHPHSENGVPLIKIYGPNIRFDRGSALAFNVFDWKGDKIDPTLVKKLADRYNISVTRGFLKNIWFSDTYNEVKDKMLEIENDEGYSGKRAKEENKKSGKCCFGISVVTISIGFLTNFEDLYRLWAFVSRFLDADFVEKERWRYMAINQTTVEV